MLTYYCFELLVDDVGVLLFEKLDVVEHLLDVVVVVLLHDDVDFDVEPVRYLLKMFSIRGTCKCWSCNAFRGTC